MPRRGVLRPPVKRPQAVPYAPKSADFPGAATKGRPYGAPSIDILWERLRLFLLSGQAPQRQAEKDRGGAQKNSYAGQGRNRRPAELVYHAHLLLKA